MVRIITACLLAIFFYASPALAWMNFQTFAVGEQPATAITWIHNLSLDDNAASTTVVNSGTGAAWTGHDNTSTYHSATVKEGTGAFLLNTDLYYLYSGENWTAEKFEAKFWWRPINAAAADSEMIFQVGDGDASTEANEIIFRRSAATGDELSIYAWGNSGSYGYKTSTDFAPSANTYYFLKVTIDASNGWTVGVGYNTDGSDSFTNLSFGAWQNSTPATAVFSSPVWLGTTSIYEPDAIIDHFRMRSTE